MFITTSIAMVHRYLIVNFLLIQLEIFASPFGSSDDASWVLPDQNNFFDQLENELNEAKHSKDILKAKNTLEVSETLENPRRQYSESTQGDDIITYQEKIFNRKSSLCWMEIVRVTEDKICCNKSISKEYSIILESPSVEERQSIQDDSNMRNFTRVEQTLNTIITEHRKMICGFGPIFTKQYSKWPNSKRERVEIVLGSNNKEGDAYNPSLATPFVPSTETSSTFDTIRTPSIFDILGSGQKRRTFDNKPTIKAEEPVFGSRSPAKNAGSSRNFFLSDPNKVVLKTFVAHRNMSYKSSDNSNFLKNPFDDTNLISRFNRAKKPILFNILFPNDDIFNNITQFGGGNSYEVTVQLIVTLAERNRQKYGVTLQLTETTYIDVETFI